MTGKRGRPSKKTDETCASIIERIRNGEPLAQICRDSDMPDASTVDDWINADPDFSRRFARARQDGHDMIAARLRLTARGVGESTGDIQRDKLIIETDLKLLSKWDRRYGDKLTVEGNQVVVNKYDFDGAPIERLEQLEALLAELGGSKGGAGEAEPASVH